MKKILLISLVFLMFGLMAKAQGNDAKKTYYDDAKTKMKEAYMTRQVYTFGGDASAAEKTEQKHGPYYMYFENGKLQISGSYNADQKDGEWKYYDDKGKLLKIENYKNGVLQEE
jgi:antitoxin component YwqK of YwqJK toxin-antitoxin module